MHNLLPLAFGTLGPMEIAAIFILILLLFGAKKLPELARGVGKSMGEFKKAREEFEHEITRSEEEVKHSSDKKSAAEVKNRPAEDKESHDA